MSSDPTEKRVARPVWTGESTEIVIVQPDGSAEARVIPTPQAASELQHLIAEKIRLGGLALDAVVIYLSARE